MDRFLDTADPQKKAKSKSIQTTLNAQKERLRLLTEGKVDIQPSELATYTHRSVQFAPFSVALQNTLGFLSKQDSIELCKLDDNLVSQLNNEQLIVEAEIEGLRNDIVKLKEELEEVWKDDTEFPYELTSVFIHRGSSPSFGHYFFYSRHLPDKPDSWFKYNDSIVSDVSKDEVLADTTGSTANPYLVSFWIAVFPGDLRWFAACLCQEGFRCCTDRKALRSHDSGGHYFVISAHACSPHVVMPHIYTGTSPLELQLLTERRV